MASKSVICFSILVFLTAPECKLIVTPTDVNVTEGQSVRLKCSTDSGKPVNWQCGRQVNKMWDVYISGEGLVSSYRNLKRYSVDENSATGQYDLLISNATFDDAGYCICSEPKGKDDPPHARLLVSGIESLTTFCRKDFVIAVIDTNAELTFSGCKKPFYISHLPFGERYFKAIFDRERLINGYADGRFGVQEFNDGACVLSIQNASRLDAGTFTCTDNAGSGEKHAVELVTLVRSPECSADQANSSLVADPRAQIEAHCEAKFIGNCVPILSWWHQNGSTGGYTIDPVLMPTQQSEDTVSSTLVISPNGKLTCSIWEPHTRGSSLPQCSLLLENGGDEGNSSEQGGYTWILVLATVLGVLVSLVIIPVICYVCCRSKPKEKPIDDPTSSSLMVY